MIIEDHKAFERFLKICRKQSVSEISAWGISVKFGESSTKQVEATDDSSDEETIRPLTIEELMANDLEV